MPRGPKIAFVLSADGQRMAAELDPAVDKLRKLGGAASEAGGKVVQMGNQSRTSLLQTSAVVRSLEGNFQSNTRAISQFLTNTLKLGPILSAAFNVVGPLLLGKAIIDTGEKLAKFITDARNAPAKIAESFRAMNAPVKLSVAELQLQSDRLANDIAKLEGKRQNTLKVALDEVNVAAMKLSETLEKDITDIHKLFEEQSGYGKASGVFKWLVGVNDSARDLSVAFGGLSGSGGYKGEISKIEADYEKTMEIAAKLTDSRAQAAARLAAAAEKDRASLDVYGRAEKTAAQAVKDAQKVIDDAKKNPYGPSSAAVDEANKKKEMGLGAQADMQARQSEIRLSAITRNQEYKKSILETANANAKAEAPLQKLWDELDAKIKGVQERLAAVGTDPWHEALARGAKEAAEAIAKVSDAMKFGKAHRPMDDAEADKTRALFAADVTATETLRINTYIDKSIKKINEETQAYRDLASAIGQGFDAEQKMRIEAEVAKQMVGTELVPGNPGYAERAAQLRGPIAAQIGAKDTDQAEKIVVGLGEQIRLQALLAEAEKLGEAEVRKLTAAQIQYNAFVKYGLAGITIGLLEVTEYYKKLEVEANKRIAQLNLETTANQKLAAATLRSAEAARLQRLENEYAKLKTGGASDQEIAAKRAEDQSAYELKIAESAAKRLEVYRADVTELQRERSVLQAMVNAGQDIVAAKKAQRDIDDEILKKEVQQALAMGTLRDGMRAFFLEMQEQGKKFSQIIYDELNSALDKISDQLAKLFTGQKTSFAKMLQGIGESLTKDSIKKGLQTGLGALGGVLTKQGGILGKIGGIIGGVGQKPDGSSPARALWVRLTGGGGGASQGESGTESAESPVGIGTRASPLGGLPSAIGSIPGLTAQGAVAAGGAIWHALSGLFGSGGGTAVSSSISYGGALAGGGDVSPGMSYIVGENAPEIFQPRSSGRVIPIDRFMGNGGGGTTYIDARGSDIGVANRLLRITDHNDRSVLSNSVVANHDRAQRTPTRRTG